MFRLNRYTYFLLVLFVVQNLFSQNLSKTDSLAKKIRDEKRDSVDVYLYDDLAWELMNTNPDSAINTSKQGLLLSRKISWKRGQSLSLASLGTFYFLKGDYAPALDFYLQALKINESMGYSSSTAHSLGNIGNLFYNQQEFTKALAYYERALAIEQQILSETKDEEKKQYRLNRISMWQGNIGNVYNGKAQHEVNPEKKQKLLQKALSYYELALATDEKLNDQTGVSNWLSNIGVVYEQQARITKNKSEKNTLTAKALGYYEKSRKLEAELGNTNGLAQRIMNIGKLFSNTGKYAAAEKELLNALKLFKSVDARDDERLTLESLASNYESMGRHKEALIALKKAISLKDSIFNEEKNLEMARKEMSFEFEKKEAIAKAEHQKELESEKAIAEEKSRKQKVIIYSIVAGLFLVVFFAAFILRSLRLTQKQKRIIEIQKTEVDFARHLAEEQKKLVEEKNRDITDSINYAQRIQHALLAPRKLLSEYLKEYFILFKPKDIVSGDFYWARALDNDLFALVTADSTGHGVPGAIMSMLNMASLKEVTGKSAAPANEILFETRRLIIEYLKNDGSVEGGKDGMDCSLAIFDFNKKILYAACANNPVWIIRNNEIIELNPDKMPVGKHDKDSQPFTLHTFHLLKGDMVYTLTDGFPDQFGGPAGKKFMHKSLKKLLIEISIKNVPEQHAILDKVFEEWKGNSEQVDDVTVIGIRI